MAKAKQVLQSNKNLNKALKLVGEYYTEEVKSQLKRDGQYSSGNLANSVDYELESNAIEIVSNRYGEAVDQGSSPSKKGFGLVSRTFVNDILQWAKNKGISPKNGPATEGNMRKMAYAIGRTIQRDGIIQGYGNTGSKVFDRVYARLEDRIEEDILEGYKKDIEEVLNELNNTNKKNK